MAPAGLTRRAALQLAGGAACVAVAPWAWATGRIGLHGLSIFGNLKYPAGFTQFDYVNADAPKGGRMNFQPPFWYFNQNTQTFNTLNGFVLRGDAPPRMELIFDKLMARATDEPDAVYGLLAETVDVSEDGNVFTFHLRDGTRFHDGSPLTAEDVAFSLMLLKEQGHPNISQIITAMANAEALDAKTVAVTLDGTQSRDTILTIVDLPIFSKAYYTANTFDASTLTPPLGSGAYKVGRLSAGRYVEFERVGDYWGRDLPVNAGSGNFDVIRIDFFRERQPAFEAFKKGDITYREEFTSKTWVQEYNFPAFVAGKVRKTLFPAELRPSMQGWMINTRRSKFSDRRTRQAIGLAFDFEWSNRNLFFDAYTREDSYFEKSDYAARGVPAAAELALLEPHRADLPPEVFGEPYVPPVSDGSGRDRKLLRQASELLAEAGWKQDGRFLVDGEGTRLTVEFLLHASVFERVTMPYVENLRRIGVDASLRVIDPAQYQVRTADFDFDIVMFAIGLSATPLDGLQQIFSTRSADTSGSYNYAGIKEPIIDTLLKRVPNVETREELITLTRVLDRILRAQHYWVPNWYLAEHRVAHWDLFGWPATKPDYAFTPETTWWFDRDRAAAIGMAG
ncbi:MAG: ABC transporter substrate-binding protein [Bauldia sp.]|uniref:extracellular solute-binding protein n=1 Tax=Bauldia sp. TaxID=2575872 RepID=UPI001DD20659|nr:extracellular solute-binding protein [Bauldia sp.]MCB1495152.1 ABC transporter substrate-binding protein [Bauldia sp.]